MERRRGLSIGLQALGGVIFALLSAGPLYAQSDPKAGLTNAEFESFIAELDSILPDEETAETAPETTENTEKSLLGTGFRFDPATLTALRSRVETAIQRMAQEARAHIPEQAARRLADQILSGKRDPELEKTLLEALAVALVALLLVRRFRGRGDLAVTLHYPAELRGTFNVRISKRVFKKPLTQRVTNPEDAARIKKNAAAATRTEHTMVSRETYFRGLLARRYCVTVYGFIQTQEGEDIISTHLEDKQVQIRRGRTDRVDFDFQPRQCSVDVTVLWDRRPVAEALVALRGEPDSLRYARGGPARLPVEQGRHTLVVGSGDRVAEHALMVDSFKPLSIEVDLTGRKNVLFSGCPPAVEPYLHGDLPAAARALEREGQSEVSHLVFARLYHERGQDELAAEHYDASGRPLDAAEIHQALGNFKPAAELFERADEPTRAAEMWRAAGELTMAGEAYERANRLDAAVECYEEANDISRWTAALERNGSPLEAAQVAIDRDDWGRAIRSLHMIGVADPSYVTATNLLIDAYQRSGHLDLALRKIEELVHNKGIDSVSIESCDQLAQLLEVRGELERALSVLEIVRQCDATYPNVATRIEALSKRATEGATTELVADSDNAFGTGSRYEILEELGRGGMGVVFKARDRRLEREVALKQLPEKLRNHPKAVQLFLREARSAAVLNHPNIVTVYDAGEESDTLYITMELLEGLPLQTILRQRGRLSSRDAARLGMQISNGLDYAHQRRIIHRDIKTGNLFFTHSKKVKIMDFGLAKMLEEVRKSSTVIGGTPFYMAPEQSLGESVDHRADLYALGVTFFELLTGRVPFKEGDVSYHHRHTQPPDPREFADNIPTEFAQLILQLLEKSPDDRCESGAEISQRLQEISRL